MLEDGPQDGGAIGRRRTSPAPFAFIDEVPVRALQEEHPDLPLPTPADMEMRREVVRGVNPQIQPLERERLDSSQAILCVSPRVSLAQTGHVRNH